MVGARTLASRGDPPDEGALYVTSGPLTPARWKEKRRASGFARPEGSLAAGAASRFALGAEVPPR